MMTSPGDSSSAREAMVDSVGSPDGTITQTARGRSNVLRYDIYTETDVAQVFRPAVFSQTFAIIAPPDCPPFDRRAGDRATAGARAAHGAPWFQATRSRRLPARIQRCRMKTLC